MFTADLHSRVCNLLTELLHTFSAHCKLAGFMHLDSEPTANMQQKGKVSRKATYLAS